MKLEGFADQSNMLRPGIYALCYRGAVVYVGKAKILLTRIYSHRNSWGKERRGQKLPDWLSRAILFDEVHVFPCRIDQLDEREREFIDRYNPRYNRRLRTGNPSFVVNGIMLGVKPPPPEPMTRRSLG